jgi:polysaccharide biosynthesis transport protein
MPSGVMPRADNAMGPYAYPGAPVVIAQPPGEDDSVKLGAILKALRYHWLTIAALSIFGLSAGLLFCLWKPAVYEAQTVLEIQVTNDSFLNSKELEPVSSDNGESHFPTQIKLLKSRSLLRRVAEKLNLEQHPEFAVPEIKQTVWQKIIGRAPPKPLGPTERAMQVVNQNLTISPLGATRLVEVRYRASDAKIASEIPNTVAQEYVNQSLEGRWNTIERTGEWLARQVDDIKKKLELSEQKLQEYARSNELVFISEKGNVAEEKLRQLQEDLSKAYADRVQKQSLYEIANGVAPEDLPKILDNPLLRDYQSKVVDLRRELAQLRSTLTPAHYKVKRVEAQLKELESSLDPERTRLMARMQNEYETARRRETLLTDAYRKQTQQVSTEAYSAIQYNLLKRDVDANRNLYEAMLSKVKEAGITSALRTGNARIIDPAEVPVNPLGVNLMLGSGLGLFGGLLLGSVIAIGKELITSSIKHPGEAVVCLNVPELAVIPSAKAESKELMRPGNGLLGEKRRLELVTSQLPDSWMAESFRSTLHALVGNGVNGELQRVIAFTSPNPMDGKTTVITNVAIACAEAGLRVLLIDGDLRKPRLHDIFSMDRGPGLVDVLRQPTLGALDKFIRPTSIPGLKLLPAGTSSGNVSSLLYSRQLMLLLRHARQHYQVVLIDTPPVLQLVDSRVIACHTDGVVLVTAAGDTEREEILMAGQRFTEDGTTILGTILNKWMPRSNADRHSYYSYYSA